MKTDIKIYGTHQRDFLIKPLQNSLNLSDEDIIYDDRPNGGLVIHTFEMAFKQPIPQDVTHRLCIPDDMIVCNNFHSIINRMINAQPDKIICLFSYSFHEHEDLYELNLPKPVNPYIINFSTITRKGSVVVEALSNNNIMVSSVSACHSSKEKGSYVVKSLGKSDKISNNTIRVSLDSTNTIEEIDIFISILEQIIGEIR